MKYGLNFNFLSKFVQKCALLKKNNDHAVPGSFFSQENFSRQSSYISRRKQIFQIAPTLDLRQKSASKCQLFLCLKNDHRGCR